MPNRSSGARKQLPPAQRGLDGVHRANRTRLLHRHVDGRRCWWCGNPMYKDRRRNWDYNPNATRSDGLPDTTSGELHADHSRARAIHGIGNTHADRLLHGTCNKQRQKGMRDDERPALLAQAAATQPTPATTTATPIMGWPWPTPP